MSKLTSEKENPGCPSAPPRDYDYSPEDYTALAPPSYEESQRMCNGFPQMHTQLQHQQFPAYRPHIQPGPMPNILHSTSVPHTQYMQLACGAPQGYVGSQGYPDIQSYPVAQVYPISQGYHAPQDYLSSQNRVKGSSNPKVLTFAKGAEILTTHTGAVSIPPPPPGSVPTSAQYAAMQGEQVLVKKKKRSFF